ncbi:c-type cytochrome [Litorisediminicola beolgyonensis]|uniref:C-type cytochrome n=1 Tax=Litorisediminicola beolgyonensis TaxID=1173614 RepID=A0ABW3ZJ96_9RHOB
MKLLRHFTTDLDWRTVRTLVAALAVAGAVGGGAVVAFGLYNVSAKVGHLPGVSPILHETFRNSVDLRAHAEPPADLQTEDRVKLGAGHYDSACRHCHAAPGQERSATVLSMVPQPPHITDAVGDWTASEFHWIVHQGVKMSGMPGWPAKRSDEVWSVVAFLMEVGEMSGPRYAELTDKPEGKTCAMCHGLDGVSGSAHIPRLDILSETYIAQSLSAYAAGTRDSGIMAEAMSHVPADAIPRLAAAFAGNAPSGGPARDVDTELAETGRALATEGGTVEVPACNACHGPWDKPLDPAFPSLAGQYAPYLKTQLELWREGIQGGGRVAELMHHAAQELTDAQIEALAAYYASLAPATLDETRD